MDTAVYIHIPFCQSKCLYCDFLSFPAQSAAVSDYLKALEHEIATRGRELREANIGVSTLYIGGGTPTVLSDDELAALLAACRLSLPLVNPEWTVEANPGTLSREKISILGASGVNRISLGVQDLCDNRLALLGRLHNAAQARQAFMACHDSFASVSVDLMAALPGQTLADLSQTLDEICQWGAEHISVYGLKVEEETQLAELVAQGKLLLPDEDTMLAMFETSSKILTACGYEHYEIANYAKPGHRSRHNQVYWQNLPYLGLGLGAHSFWHQERLINTGNLEQYQQLIHQLPGQFPIEEIHPVDLQQEMEDTMMLGLRLLDGVTYRSFFERFERDLREVFKAQITRLLALRVIECDDTAIRLTPLGLPVANAIFAEFLTA